MYCTRVKLKVLPTVTFSSTFHVEQVHNGAVSDARSHAQDSFLLVQFTVTYVFLYLSDASRGQLSNYIPLNTVSIYTLSPQSPLLGEGSSWRSGQQVTVSVDTLRLRGPGFDSRPVLNLVGLGCVGTQPSWSGQNS